MPFTLPLFRILTISLVASLKRKSASSRINVPPNRSSVWNMGETVDAPLAKKGRYLKLMIDGALCKPFSATTIEIASHKLRSLQQFTS